MKTLVALSKNPIIGFWIGKHSYFPYPKPHGHPQSLSKSWGGAKASYLFLPSFLPSFLLPPFSSRPPSAEHVGGRRNPPRVCFCGRGAPRPAAEGRGEDSLHQPSPWWVGPLQSQRPASFRRNLSPPALCSLVPIGGHTHTHTHDTHDTHTHRHTATTQERSHAVS